VRDYSGLIILLIVAITCATISGAVASYKGRNIVGWAALGFGGGFLCGVFGLIPIIIVACLPNVKEQAERDRFIAEENRRLREQLRQERIKSETFRQHAMSRLDAHDQHLGIDTRQMGPQLAAGGGGANQQLLGEGVTPGSENNDARWYYGREGRTIGPVRLSEILDMIRLQVITRETLVWSEDLVEWQPAGRIAAFAREFV